MSTTHTVTGLTPRPIRFTADLPAWRRIVEALGGVLVSEQPGWLVLQLGSGRLALHADHPDQPAGLTTLALETPEPLTEAVAAASVAGVPITLEETDHGTAGVVRADDGTEVTLDTPTPGAGRARDGRLVVLPIWYGPDASVPLAVLEGLGARRRIVGQDGGWTDLRCDGGGLLAVHVADQVGTELAFEWDGDVEDALRLLTSAGIPATLIDETYSRTLHVADPDGGKAVWVNERQTDLYGYTRVG
ncbi:hypothetical protein [Ornithinimicrobium cerasi]|uniref:VOC domain-containing protein n=1 Tax=Ornithinimicrobium cerasi TaxID=2248773 RepID=A0A285VRR7_9MICO|nr:hypothetical protein [Ornithinimicrobium cerasi]SOC56643.1 hypothetical protein SAMN05421879_10874 [Ornithinimicrobium cerasi]